MEQPLAAGARAPNLDKAGDVLADWCRLNPELAAKELRRLARVEIEAKQAAVLESWRVNPDRMGS